MNQPHANDLLTRLQRWYHTQCDGDWEHEWGIEVGTLDNPGWSLKVNLKSTDLEGRSFEPIDRGMDAHPPSTDWFTCYVEDEQFKGFGGPEKLAEILAIFLDWADSR